MSLHAAREGGFVMPRRHIPIGSDLELEAFIDEQDGGGGGSLPAWWTVDSTPGSESVEFAGTVIAAPESGSENDVLIAGVDGTSFRVRSYHQDNPLVEIDGSNPNQTLLSFAGAENATAPLLTLDDWDDRVLEVGPTGALRISPTGGAAPLTLTGLPAADPSVPGQLYHTAGAVMVSL